MSVGFVDLIGLFCRLGHVAVEIPTHLNERGTEVQPKHSATMQKNNDTTEKTNDNTGNVSTAVGMQK